MEFKLTIVEKAVCVVQAGALWGALVVLLAVGLLEHVLHSLMGKKLIDAPSGEVYTKKERSD